MKTLETLKSEAYDCVVQVQQWTKKLKEIDLQIANFKPQEEVIKAEIVEE